MKKFKSLFYVSLEALSTKTVKMMINWSHEKMMEEMRHCKLDDVLERIQKEVNIRDNIINNGDKQMDWYEFFIAC